MASQPRPKPWEQSAQTKAPPTSSAFDAAAQSPSAVHVNATAGPGPSSALAVPRVPERPEGLSSGTVGGKRIAVMSVLKWKRTHRKCQGTAPSGATALRHMEVIQVVAMEEYTGVGAWA
jgi:hypothetical protein